MAYHLTKPQLCTKSSDTYNAARSRVGHESELHPWLMLAKQNYHLTKVSIFSGQRLARDCLWRMWILNFSLAIPFCFHSSEYLSILASRLISKLIGIRWKKRIFIICRGIESIIVTPDST